MFTLLSSLQVLLNVEDRARSWDISRSDPENGILQAGGPWAEDLVFTQRVVQVSPQQGQELRMSGIYPGKQTTFLMPKERISQQTLLQGTCTLNLLLQVCCIENARPSCAGGCSDGCHQWNWWHVRGDLKPKSISLVSFMQYVVAQ